MYNGYTMNREEQLIFLNRMKIKKQVSAIFKTTDPEECLKMAEKVCKDIHVMALKKRAYLIKRMIK